MPTASPFGIPALFRKAGPLKNSSAHTPPHHTAQPLPMSFSDPGKSKLGAVASNASSRPAAKRKPPSRDSPLSQLAYGPNFPARPHICKPSMPPTPSSLLPPGTKSPRKSALCCASCRERIRERKSKRRLQKYRLTEKGRAWLAKHPTEYLSTRLPQVLPPDGLNYVNCSPFRVPVARLTAAQAALEETK
jgi:hypothetical protein